MNPTGPHTLVVSDTLEALDFQSYRLRPTKGRRGERFERHMIFIGSAPDNDLELEDPTVSRLHARLEFDGTGYRLTDLGSRNGTWVDGVRIREAFLAPAATLRFGQCEVAFALDDLRIRVELTKSERLGRLIGRSAPMREVFALIPKVAQATSPVLIEGEPGTGKALVAEAIHQHAPRRDRAFIVVDCAAVPAELLEIELFGATHTAHSDAEPGAFLQADGGTLVLGGVTELPQALQTKLLRAIERGEVRPVGASHARAVDVRLIAVTDRPLDPEVASGTFKSDLAERLATLRIKLPPLRHRPEDIPLLVEHFLTLAGAKHVAVGWETMRRLQAHPWAGNVRELRSYVERAVALAEHGRLETRHLATPAAPIGAPSATSTVSVDIDTSLAFKDAKAALLEAFETRYWRSLLDESGGNASEAARRGGIHRKSLEYIIKKYDLGAS